MATTETKEKATEKAIEIYPTAELINAINRMLTEKIPVKIALVSDTTGDVAFIATLNDLGITRQVFSHPFYRSNLWSELLGQLLVRQNLNAFCERVMDKNYNTLAKKYNHTGMGMRTIKDNTLMFQMHMSLISKLVNEQINQTCAEELAKLNIISGAKKIKPGEEPPSITSYCDNHNVRLTISNHSSVRHAFENAIKTILNFYNIKGKTIFITQNMFNWDIEIKDEAK
jgi:hypothetical protein